MRLEKASSKAIKYACLNFHYAKVCPVTSIAFSVFNSNNDWCGVITFGGGAGANMGMPYKLRYGQYLELTRMALNGKQESTSKAMSIAIKLIKKNCPSVKLLISYADKAQNHYGTIYQATNWYFVEETESSGEEVFYKGKWVHNRMSSQVSKEYYKSLPKRKKSGKRKYLYPLNKTLIPLCKSLSKPYPKQAVEVHKLNSSQTSEKVGGANPTQPL